MAVDMADLDGASGAAKCTDALAGWRACVRAVAQGPIAHLARFLAPLTATGCSIVLRVIIVGVIVGIVVATR